MREKLNLKLSYVAEKINDKHYGLILQGVLEYFDDQYLSKIQATRNKKDSPAVIEAKKLITTCTDIFYDLIVMGGDLSRPLSSGQKEALIRNFAHLSVKVVMKANLTAEYVGAYGDT